MAECHEQQSRLREKGMGFYIVVRADFSEEGHLSRYLDELRKGNKQILIILHAIPSFLLKDFTLADVPSPLFIPLSSPLAYKYALISSILRIKR